MHLVALGATRCNKVQPRATRCMQVQPGLTRCNHVPPVATRCSQVQPGATRCNQVQPGATRCNQVHSCAIRCSSQVQPGSTRFNQVQSGTIRYNQVTVGTSVPGTSAPDVPIRPCTRYQCTRCTNKTKTKSAVLPTSLMLFLASQSDAHRIAPHRDFHPTQPIPLKALKQERPM